MLIRITGQGFFVVDLLHSDRWFSAPPHFCLDEERPGTMIQFCCPLTVSVEDTSKWFVIFGICMYLHLLTAVKCFVLGLTV